MLCACSGRLGPDGRGSREGDGTERGHEDQAAARRRQSHQPATGRAQEDRQAGNHYHPLQ